MEPVAEALSLSKGNESAPSAHRSVRRESLLTMARSKNPGSRNGASQVHCLADDRTREAMPRATLIPGDGVGPEVTAAAVRVLDAAGVRVNWDIQEAGAATLKKLGTPIPDVLGNSTAHANRAQGATGDASRPRLPLDLKSIYERLSTSMRICGRRGAEACRHPFAMSTSW